MWRKPLQVQIFERHSDHSGLFRWVYVSAFIKSPVEFGSVKPVGRRPNSDKVLRSWLNLRRETVSYRRYFQRFLDFTGGQWPPLGRNPVIQHCKNATVRPDQLDHAGQVRRPVHRRLPLKGTFDPMRIANLDYGSRVQLRVCPQPTDQCLVLDRHSDVKKMDFNDVERIREQNDRDQYDREGVQDKLQPPENNERIGQVEQHEVLRTPSPLPGALSDEHEGCGGEKQERVSGRQNPQGLEHRHCHDVLAETEREQ